MTKLLDITGQTFGKLTAINISTRTPRIKWNCICSCGKNTVVISAKLVNGHTKSCGCLKFESKNFTHGMSGTKTHHIWVGMKARCYNVKNNAYMNYGGRGITVCDQWLESFESFFADMGECPHDRSIERTDNNLGYSPENCKYARIYEQANNKRDTIFLTLDRVTKSLPQWSRILGINYSVLFSRIKLGWSDYDILTKPIQNTGVTFRKDRSTWSASITINKKMHRLGCFKKKEDAIDARRKAEIKYLS